MGTMAYILGSMNVRGEWEKKEVWSQIYQDFDECLRELEPMVPLFHLDRMALFRIYDRLRDIKEGWIQQRVCGFHRPALEPDGLDEKQRTLIRKEEYEFVGLIDQVKRLIVAAP